MPEQNISQVKKKSILVVFDRIIKDPDMFILDKVIEHYDTYKDYLNLDPLMLLPKEERYKLMMCRTEVNIFKWLMKKKFNYQESYDRLYKKYKRMYIDIPFLPMTDKIARISKSYLVDSIYIWNPTFDLRQEFEVATAFDTDSARNIFYTKGRYEDVLESVDNIGVIFDWNLERIRPLAEDERNYLYIIPKYGFNYDLKDKLADKRDALDKLFVSSLSLMKYGLGELPNVGDFDPYGKYKDTKADDAVYG